MRTHWNYFSRNLLCYYLSDVCRSTSDYFLMEKNPKASYKDWQRFFFNRNISSVSHLNKSYSNKEKNVWWKWFICVFTRYIIACIYSVGEFYWENLQTTCKIMKKEQNYTSNFSTFSIDNMKTKNFFVGIKILNNSQNTTLLTKHA